MTALHWSPTMHDFNRKLDGQPLFRIGVVKNPGTWAGPDIGFQADLARALNPHVFADIDNYYGEGFGPINGPIDGPSYIETVREGVDKAVAILSDLDAQYIITGFSKGAQVAYEIAREHAEFGRLAHRERDLLSVVTFGDPCRFYGSVSVGHNPSGLGIARRPPLPPHLASRYLSFALDGDMYCTADPEQDYLWIGYAALAGEYDRPGSGLQFHDLPSLAAAMLELIQRDEFVDAIAELLPPAFPGLSNILWELTGVDGDRLLANRSPISGGLLSNLLRGGPVLATPAGLFTAGAGFLGGLISGIPTVGPLVGGLLTGGHTGGTAQGWVKMGRTVSKLLTFAATNDHMNYAAPHRAVFDGKTAVHWAADYLNHRGVQLL